MTVVFVLVPLFFLTAGAMLIWSYRGLWMSLAVRFLASLLPNAARRHRIKINFGEHEGGWIRFTLQANLGKALSQVVGYPLEAAAYSRFGGFNLSRRYSDFLNPDSPYYQCWLGAYVVFDGDGHRAFGFDERGQLLEEEVLAALEADQRLVYRSTGCPHRFPDGNVVRLKDHLAVEPRQEDGITWWCASGQAETWSVYHRGATSGGSRLRSLIYGSVPSAADHSVGDYHPLTCEGEFWMRYSPDYAATCAKFCIWPRYTNREGSQISAGEPVVTESRRLLTRIAFTRL